MDWLSPASAGKSLVGELTAMHVAAECGKDALIILPYVSIVEERFRALEPLSARLGLTLEIYAGPRGRFPPVVRRTSRTLYIATIEKAAGIIDAFAELPGAGLGNLGLVVVDELHMLGQGDRGATLEMLLHKALRRAGPGLAAIGLSATISNLTEVATFLDAIVFDEAFRPVTLKEMIKVREEQELTAALTYI